MSTSYATHWECGRCGFANDLGTGCCWQCGLERDAAYPAPVRRCPRCDTELAASDGWCRQCERDDASRRQHGW